MKFGLCLGICLSSTLAIADGEIGPQLDYTKGLSPSATAFVCRTYPETFSKADSQKQSSNITASLSEMGQKYNEQRAQIRKALGIASGTSTVIREGLKTYVDLDPRIPTAMKIPARWLIQAGDNAAKKNLEAMAQESKFQTQQLLRNQLRNDTGQFQAQWQEIRKLGPEEARTKTRELMEEWGHQFTSNIKDPQERREVDQLFTASLVEAAIGEMNGVQAENNVTNEIQNQTIAQNAQDITKTNQVLVRYQKRTDDRIQNIKDLTSEINSDIQSIHESAMKTEAGLTDAHRKLDRIQTDLGFTQEFMFGQMPPEEQLRALNRGFFPEMPMAERAALEKKIQLVKKKQQLSNVMSQTLGSAQDVIDIAKTIGLNGKFISQLQEGVERGSKIASGINSLVNQNYLGAMKDFAGAIFGSGPDIGEIRHQEVMKSLKELAEGQEMIFNQQKVMIENQIKIYDAISHVSKQIESLAERIQADHAKVISSIDALHQAVLVNRQMILRQLTKDLRRCETFLNGANQLFAQNQMPANTTADRFKQLGYDFGQDLIDCRTGLDDVFRPSNFASSLLSLEYWIPHISDGVSSYLQDLFIPLMTYYTQRVEPSPSLKALNPTILLDLKDKLMAITPYLEVFDLSRNHAVLLTPEDFKKTPRTIRHIGLLQSLYQTLLQSIAIERITAGTPEMFTKIREDLSSTSTENIETATKLLEANPLLAENFVKDSLRSQFIKTDTGITGYQLVLRAPKGSQFPILMAKMPHMRIEEIEEKSQGEIIFRGIRFGKRIVSLPDPKDLLQPNLAKTETEKLLQRAADDVLNTLTDVQFESLLEKNTDRETLRFLYILGK